MFRHPGMFTYYWKYNMKTRKHDIFLNINYHSRIFYLFANPSQNTYIALTTKYLLNRVYLAIVYLLLKIQYLYLLMMQKIIKIGTL